MEIVLCQLGMDAVQCVLGISGYITPKIYKDNIKRKINRDIRNKVVTPSDVEALLYCLINHNFSFALFRGVL